jgi:hypothetical protein
MSRPTTEEARLHAARTVAALEAAGFTDDELVRFLDAIEATGLTLVPRAAALPPEQGEPADQPDSIATIASRAINAWRLAGVHITQEQAERYAQHYLREITAQPGEPAEPLDAALADILDEASSGPWKPDQSGSVWFYNAAGDQLCLTGDDVALLLNHEVAARLRAEQEGEGR